MTMESGDARCSGGGGGGGEGGSASSEAGSEPGDYGHQPTPPVPDNMEVDNEDSCSQDQTNNNTAPPTVSPRNALAPSSREMRNRAEKQRRDKLNTYVTELAQLNPLIASTEKKLDKTSVLRLSAAYIRLHQTVRHEYEELCCCTPCCPAITAGPNTSPSSLGVPSSAPLSQTNSKHTLVVKQPKAITNGNNTAPRTPRLRRYFTGDFPIPYDITEQMLEDMDGFLMILSATGKIVFVSQNITKLLGHAQNDLLGQSLFNITCPSDHDELRKSLQPDPRTPSCHMLEEDSQRRSFYVKLSQRATSRGEHAVYEMVHIVGQLRIPKRNNNEVAVLTTTQLARKSARHRDGNLDRNHQDTVLIAVGKLTTSYRRDLSIMDATKDEYVTRHTLEGLIIYCDHRISVVAGYMPEEVSSFSAFGYMHSEDVRWTLVSLRQMYSNGGGYGSSVYRLLAKNGEFIYLRTHGHLEFDETGQKPISFICVNSLLNEEEGEQGLVDMRTRFSGFAGHSTTSSSLPECFNKQSLQSPELPQKTLDEPSLQRLIIANLGTDPQPVVPSESQPLPDTQYLKCAMLSKTLPPPAIQVAQLPHRRRESSTTVGSPSRLEPSGSPRPFRANGRTTSMCSASPTESLHGSTSPHPPSEPEIDPLLAGGTGTCYTRITRRREIIAMATGTLTIQNAFMGQVTSSSIELETRGAGNGSRGTGRRGGRRQQQARLNKRALSGEEVETVVSKRACPELPSVGWEQHTAIDPPMLSPAHSVSSNDTDFSSLALDSSEPEDQNSDFQTLLLGDLIVPLRGSIENETDSTLPQTSNPSVLRRDVLDDVSTTSATTVCGNVHHIKSNKQTDIGV